MLILVPSYQQTTSPEQLRFGPIDSDRYQVFVSKTRARFRRGFYENGCAKTIPIVDAPGDWFGAVRLDALDYQNLVVRNCYPFGDVHFMGDELANCVGVVAGREGTWEPTVACRGLWLRRIEDLPNERFARAARPLPPTHSSARVAFQDTRCTSRSSNLSPQRRRPR